MITEEKLKEWEDLIDSCSPEPWLITLPDGGLSYTDGAVIWAEAVAGNKPGWVADGVNIGEIAPPDSDYGTGINSNGLFVAEARTALPLLISEVRRLREWVANCEGRDVWKD
jgi:hypothetical protein